MLVSVPWREKPGFPTATQMQPVPSAQPWQQYVSPSWVYPSPGQSFLIIPQLGHAGFGIDFLKRRPCGFLILKVAFDFIWWTAFHKREIDSRGTFAWVTRTKLWRQCQSGSDYARRRIAEARLKREIPLKIRLMPTSVPMNHSALLGHCDQIRIARINVTIASNNTQPALIARRSWK